MKSKRNIGQTGNLDDTADEVQAPRDEDVDRFLGGNIELSDDVDGVLNGRKDVDVILGVRGKE